jgi:DNA mismatch repair protein MutL
VTQGTTITIDDIFGKLPARLKFLKDGNKELAKCIDIIENFALVRPDINFSLRTDKKKILSFNTNVLDDRVKSVFGEKDFANAIYFEEKSNYLEVKGYLFHPFQCKNASNNQRVFINNRIVKDKTISVALKIGYRDFIFGPQYPSALIFVNVDPFYVDVNVSPTKSEVRFRDQSNVQGILIGMIKKITKQFEGKTLNPSNDSKSNQSDLAKVIERYDTKAILDRLEKTKIIPEFEAKPKSSPYYEFSKNVISRTIKPAVDRERYEAEIKNDVSDKKQKLK